MVRDRHPRSTRNIVRAIHVPNRRGHDVPMPGHRSRMRVVVTERIIAFMFLVARGCRSPTMTETARTGSGRTVLRR